MRNPEFIVFCGPMFGSKTTQLLTARERHKYQDKVILTVKPRMDARYSCGEIVTHSGWGISARLVETGQDILDIIAESEKAYDVVVLDEAFMVPGAADALVWLFRQGITIVTATLDISATGKVFDEVRDLLSWATRVVKCPAVCTVCQADAYYTHRKMENSEEIVVGGAEMYEPRCFTHHVIVNERDT